MEVVQTDPEVLKNIAVVTGIAGLISPVVLYVVEAVKQAIGNEKINGLLTILTSLLVGLLIGLAIPSVGLASGGLAGVFAVAGMTVVRNVGKNAVTEILKATAEEEIPEPPSKN